MLVERVHLFSASLDILPHFILVIDVCTMPPQQRFQYHLRLLSSKVSSSAASIVQQLITSFFPSCRFKVMDDEFGRDDLAAWACFRLDRLQSGYRLIHLFDAEGVQSKGVLLVRVTKSFVVETPPAGKGDEKGPAALAEELKKLST